MIEKLNIWDMPKRKEVPDGYEWTEVTDNPNDQILMDKINEIIDVLKKLEEDKVSRKPNGHYPVSCMSCTATHP